MKLVFGGFMNRKRKNRVYLPTNENQSIPVDKIENHAPGLLEELQKAGLKLVAPGESLSFKISQIR